MSKIFGSVDIEDFTTKENGTCKLTGWRGTEKPGPVPLFFLCDGQVVPFTKEEYVVRKDVFRVCTCLNPEEDKVGFEVTVSNLEELIRTYDQFQVVARHENNEEILWEKKSPEIKNALEGGMIQYQIDRVRKNGNLILVEGWAIDRKHEISLNVRDASGNPIVCECTRMMRPDVSRVFELKEDTPCGFEVKIQKENISGKLICISFCGGQTEETYTIDLKKFEFEHSAHGRFLQTFHPSRLRENIRMIKRDGWSQFADYVKTRMEGDLQDYEVWRKHYAPTAKELKAQRAHLFAYAPKISIAIPLYNTPISYLEELLDSIVGQTYANWELCLADGSTQEEVGAYIRKKYGTDRRIRYERMKENLGIAGNTNAAVAMATGEYVMLCDHDDLLEISALYEMVLQLNQDPSIDIIYTDEDLVNSDTTEYYSPRFKPDYNPDFLRSINYICHIFMVRKTILNEVGCFREEFDGAQDWDFILRCCEKSDRICHIPKVLYHWRAHENSTAGNPDSKKYAIDAGKRALEQHYARLGLEAELRYTDIFIMFQTILKVQGNPKVSVIISSKDHIDDLEKCITSIEEKTTWKNYEIIVVENNSEEPETFAYYEQLMLRYENVRVVYWKDEFNYSAINNFGASYATGDYYLLLNNDIEVITPQWMEWMLGYCQREDVGIVGAKLYYPDDTVQHCGAVIGLGGFAGHVLTRSGREDVGYFGRLKAIQDISAVTAACLMIKKTTFEAVQGLDESFKVALNDMDLCLKVRALGQLIVLNPWAELYHYESKSRGMETEKTKYERFKGEVERFRTKWDRILQDGDPYYNKNMTLMYGDCSLRGKYEHFDIIDEIAGGK